MKPAIIILGLLSLGLVVALVTRQNSIDLLASEKRALEERVAAYSNQVEEARAKLGEQEKLSAYLQSNLTLRASELASASNAMQMSTTALAQAADQTRAAQAENQQLTNRLAQVEGERDGLQTRLNQLAQQINGLNDKISETQRKLASAEGDRDFLTKELARLQSDKAELVRQFNNVAAVRAQLALLKEESAVNQRLSWMSQGIYQRSGLKGAQALMARPATSSDVSPSLDVEFHQNPTNSTNSTIVKP